MFDDEKLRVTLNIAGEQVKTVINRSDEEELRMLEKEVTSLFNRWRVADPSRTKSQVLAMVAANILWKSVYKLKYNSYFCKNLDQNG